MLGLLLGGIATELLVFPWVSVARRRRIQQGWSRWLLGACGVRIEPPSDVPPGACLLVANHRSWLDIFVIAAVMPAQFVAKAEIRGWPLVGPLCALAGTHFIERHRRHAVRDVVGRLVTALRDGHRVAVFPEGTTGDGVALLRFHANLVQAAVDAPVPVVPVALRYLDAAGAPSQAVLFVGQTTFGQSVWQVAAEPRTTAQLMLAPAIAPEPSATRHALTRRAEAAIADALGLAGATARPADDAADSRPAPRSDRAAAPQ
jgi:1-acyl-sn-glycerol-3-phosphate acyltransferase